MSEHCDTIKVKPWANGQGDFVLINVKDFDPSFHVKLDAEPEAKKEAPAIEQEAPKAKRR